jgi:predicted glycosyltransferase
MNREAVVLGSPVYSLFMGRLGSVDRFLIDSGKMAWIKDSLDINRIKITKKSTLDNKHQQMGQNLVAEIVDRILEKRVIPLQEDGIIH